MDCNIINSKNVTLLIHKYETLNARQAKDIVRSALCSCGYQPWEEMSIDLFEGEDDLLLIALPSEEPQVVLADYSIPFIKEYFTD